MRKKRIVRINQDVLLSLEDAIKNYDSNRLEIEPNSVCELMEYYMQNTDAVYSSLRNVFFLSFEVIDNEIRAMLGHCVDIDYSNPKDKNLEKAYSHFRRLNIDAFKTICDEFDKFYMHWYETHYKCDFSEMRTGFLQCIAKKYYDAKVLYTDAQHAERVGSDSGRHKVLEEYSKAALAYVDMLKLYVQYRSKVVRIKVFSVLSKVGAGIVAAVSLVSGLLTFL